MGTNFYWSDDEKKDSDSDSKDNENHIGKRYGMRGGCGFIWRKCDPSHFDKLKKIALKTPNKKCVKTENSELLSAKEFLNIINQCSNFTEYDHYFC